MKNRYYFIDVLKTIGICQFIVWHVFVNFYQFPKFDSPIFRLNFSVTGLFVFLSGFIIGFHYFSTIREPDHLIIFKRLFLRALKLLLIVFLVGLVINSFHFNNLFHNSKDVLFSMLSLFYKDRWDISLQVLVAIAMTLNAGYVILFFGNNRIFKFFMVFLVLCVLFSELILNHQFPYLWRYTLIGVSGIYVAEVYKKIVLLDRELMNKLIKPIALLFVYIFFLFECGVFKSKGFYLEALYKVSIQVIPVIAFSVGFSFFLYKIFDVGKSPFNSRGFQYFISLMGKHSLFVYILQIVLINALDILISPSIMKQSDCLQISFLILIFCIMSCLLLEWSLHNNIIKKVYIAVFR